MPYSVVKFKMEHFENFDARDVQKPEIKFLMEHKDMQDLWVYKIPVFTLMYDEKPIMIYGLQSSGTGTYYVMVYAGEGIDKHRFAVVRCLYDYGVKFVGKDIRRFEAYVAATDKKATRLAKFFGFEAVGMRRQAGMHEEDQVIYDRLWRT